MAKRANPAAIGAFVVGAVALAVLGVIVLGGVRLFDRPYPVVMFFDADVNGLGVGAPVSYRGVKLGQVTAIRTEVGTPRIAVFAQLERGPFLMRLPGAKMRPALDDLIGKGLRAQLALQSVVTGQLYVSLVARPETPIRLVGLLPDMQELPTSSTVLEQITESLQKVHWEELFTSVQTSMDKLTALLQSPELDQAVRGAGQILADGQRLVRRLDADLGPLIASLKATSDTSRERLVAASEDLRALRAEASALLASLTSTSDTGRTAIKDVAVDASRMLAQLQTRVDALSTKLEATADTLQGVALRSQATLAGLDDALSGEAGLGYEASQALRQLQATSRSLRDLSDYLDRHPEALLAGKGRRGGP